MFCIGDFSIIIWLRKLKFPNSQKICDFLGPKNALAFFRRSKIYFLKTLPRLFEDILVIAREFYFMQG